MKALLLCCACLIASVQLCAYPEEPGATSSRIEKRRTRLEAMKAQGAIGENNLGFVELRGPDSKEARELVDSENSDRQAVYADQARKSNKPVDQIGRERARDIERTVPAGVWIQDEHGDWKKK